MDTDLRLSTSSETG